LDDGNFLINRYFEVNLFILFVLYNYNSDSYCIDTIIYNNLKKYSFLSRSRTDRQTGQKVKGAQAHQQAHQKLNFIYSILKNLRKF